MSNVNITFERRVHCTNYGKELGHTNNSIQLNNPLTGVKCSSFYNNLKPAFLTTWQF